MIEAIETSKVLNLKAAKSKGGKFSLQGATNRLDDIKKPTLTQAIEQNAEDKSSKQLQQATDELNAQMDKLNTNISFAFSDETEGLYIKVLEKNTGKLIREFPSEKARALAGYFKNAIGLLFDKES